MAGSGLADTVQTLTYDPLWNKVASSTDALGNITSYRYDEVTGNLL